MPCVSARRRGFNPRLPLPGGDAESQTRERLAKIAVSIHASRCREAMRRTGGRTQNEYQFQSTPPVAGRRCSGLALMVDDVGTFQSTPPVAGRRCIVPEYHHGYLGVFQSTPPVAGRRCVTTVLAPSVAARVSIHASRCREAMLSGMIASGPASPFQSTPPVAGRRCPRCTAEAKGNSRFQSTPPVAGRRCINLDAKSRAIAAVSIHASRCREAMPFNPMLDSDEVWFQSTPPVAGRRCLSGSPTSAHSYLFQSTPPVAGRRCERQSPQSAHRIVVSIHASRCREAMQYFAPFFVTNSGFNPRLPLPGGDAIVPEYHHGYLGVFQSTPPVAGRRCQPGLF